MKRQVISVHFDYLHNEAHVELNKAVITAIDRYNSVLLGIGDIYAGYRQFVTTEISLRDMMCRNECTIGIHAQDRVRSSLFRGMFDAVRSGTNHFDAEKREAAGKLFPIFDHYGSINTRTLDEETATLDDLLRELASATASACVRTLALTDWTEQLDMENRKFKDLMQACDGETTQRPLLRVHAVRIDVDKALQTMLNFFDVLATVHGLAAYERLIDELNAVFERCRNSLAQQTGTQREKN